MPCDRLTHKTNLLLKRHPRQIAQYERLLTHAIAIVRLRSWLIVNGKPLTIVLSAAFTVQLNGLLVIHNPDFLPTLAEVWSVYVAIFYYYTLRSLKRRLIRSG